LYLLFVFHYSVNVPWGGDDWRIVPLIKAAHHGQLALWSQYGDRRLVVGRAILVAFGLFDHLNERHVMLFSAFIYIASYGLFLTLLKSYRKLTWPLVLVSGVVWFSLTDWWAALWSFQLSWYLVVFFFIVMVALLLKNRPMFFGLAIIAAVAGSLSDISGLMLWPVGLICLLMARRYREVWVWGAATAVSLVVYFRGYSFANGAACHDCTASFDLHHPLLTVRFLMILVSNVVPPFQSTGVASFTSVAPVPSPFVGIHVVLGAVILTVAGYVVVQAFRKREHCPVLLIAFAVLFDLVITEGRTGFGPLTAVKSYYAIPNLILLLGIIAYGWRHPPSISVRVVAAVFLAAQISIATSYGIEAGQARHQELLNDAQTVVNFHRAPACDVTDWVSWVPTYFTSVRSIMVRDRLSLYQSNIHKYRVAGLPQCVLQGS